MLSRGSCLEEWLGREATSDQCKVVFVVRRYKIEGVSLQEVRLKVELLFKQLGRRCKSIHGKRQSDYYLKDSKGRTKVGRVLD